MERIVPKVPWFGCQVVLGRGMIISHIIPQFFEYIYIYTCFSTRAVFSKYTRLYGIPVPASELSGVDSKQLRRCPKALRRLQLKSVDDEVCGSRTVLIIHNAGSGSTFIWAGNYPKFGYPKGIIAPSFRKGWACT